MKSCPRLIRTCRPALDQESGTAETNSAPDLLCLIVSIFLADGPLPLRDI